MAVIMLKELAVYHHLDTETTMDLWEFIGLCNRVYRLKYIRYKRWRPYMSPNHEIITPTDNPYPLPDPNQPIVTSPRDHINNENKENIRNRMDNFVQAIAAVLYIGGKNKDMEDPFNVP